MASGQCPHTALRGSHLTQRRHGSSRPCSGMGRLRSEGEHASHTQAPHFRQWCRRRKSVKSLPHISQDVASPSGVQCQPAASRAHGIPLNLKSVELAVLAAEKVAPMVVPTPWRTEAAGCPGAHSSAAPLVSSSSLDSSAHLLLVSFRTRPAASASSTDAAFTCSTASNTTGLWSLPPCLWLTWYPPPGNAQDSRAARSSAAQ
mmetsp:Transcript_10896/g.28142  ORF Transcript_10896/g.28142 Transcript_10896/m.28142 type:complete len:203 (-) Transcript_10896:167-775(-)